MFKKKLLANLDLEGCHRSLTMSEGKPPIPGGAPPKSLSRKETLGSRGLPILSPKPSRLSISVQRFQSTPNPQIGRALPPTPLQQSTKKLNSEQTNALVRQKIVTSASTSNLYTSHKKKEEPANEVTRPLAVNQLHARPPLPKTRTVSQRGTRRSMTVSASEIINTPPKSQSNTLPRKKVVPIITNSRDLPKAPPRNSPSSSRPTISNTIPSPKVPNKPPIPEKPKIMPKPGSVTTPPKIPPKTSILSEEEHVQICEACKKFCNANKQLLAVSQATLSKVRSAVDPVKEKFLNDQLEFAVDDLKLFNNKFSEYIRDASRAYDQKQTNFIACLTVDIGNYSSIICAALKVAAVECEGDESVFKQCLKSITTVKDSLIQVVDVLKALPEKVDPSLVPQLEVHTKKTTTILAGLVGQKTTGPLISVGTCMEIEAATRAAVVSIAKLVNSFNGPLEQSIVSEAKVASCCVAQMWATLNEMINTNTNLLSTPEIREKIIGFTSEIKQVFAVFMEQTKKQVGNPSEKTLSLMKQSELPIRALCHKIVSQIQAFSVIDTSQKKEIKIESIKPTQEQIKVADSIVSDPEEIVPPPPTSITQSTIDVPGKLKNYSHSPFLCI